MYGVVPATWMAKSRADRALGPENDREAERQEAEPATAAGSGGRRGSALIGPLPLGPLDDVSPIAQRDGERPDEHPDQGVVDGAGHEDPTGSGNEKPGWTAMVRPTRTML